MIVVGGLSQRITALCKLGRAAGQGFILFFCVLYCAIIVVLAFEVSTDNSQKEREISLEYENSVTLLIMYIYFCGTPTHFRALVGVQSFMSVGWMICTKVCKDNLTLPRQVL